MGFVFNINVLIVGKRLENLTWAGGNNLSFATP
jgi:hypothetical protein